MLDAKSLATAIVSVDARKVGPRLGGKVQQVIKAGKAGEFTEKDGKIVIMGEEFTTDEAKIVYQGKEGQTVAADHGIVVSLDTQVSEALTLEGQARELIHAIQQLRKNAGLEFTDNIVLRLTGGEKIMAVHQELILEETRSSLGETKAKSETVDIEGTEVEVSFEKRN